MYLADAGNVKPAAASAPVMAIFDLLITVCLPVETQTGDDLLVSMLTRRCDQGEQSLIVELLNRLFTLAI
jgi:hypothetical protein